MARKNLWPTPRVSDTKGEGQGAAQRRMLAGAGCTLAGAVKLWRTPQARDGNGVEVRPLINFYGSKWNLAEWIISYFPEHEVFVDVFGGSAAITLKKQRSKREIINDIDNELVNLYQVVRDHGKELVRLLKLTPHSRAEYRLAHQKADQPIEKARRTIVKCYFGIGDSIADSTNGFRNSSDSNTCVAKSWVSYWKCLNEITDRLQGVSIENLNWRDLIEKYDGPTTLFYFDPPYVKRTRNRRHEYRYEFTDADHADFLHRIQKLQGFGVLSGYDSEVYKDLFWRAHHKTARVNGPGAKVETLWVCPKTAAQEVQMQFSL